MKHRDGEGLDDFHNSIDIQEANSSNKKTATLINLTMTLIIFYSNNYF